MTKREALCIKDFKKAEFITMDGIRQKLEIQRFSPTIYRQVIKPLDPAHIRGVSMEAVNFVEKRKYIYYGADVDNGTLIYKEVPDA